MNQSRPASATVEALLSSGRRLFARRGFDGASVRAITRDARANLGAVTYHFGSKRALYEAVLERVLSPLAERVRAAADGPGDALSRLEGVVRAFFRHLELHPDMPQLMLQEIAAGKEPPRPVREVLRTVSATLAGLVREGQEAGSIRDGDPLLMGLSCVSQPVHLTLVGRLTRRVLGVDLQAGEAHRQVVEHSVAFARGGLSRREPHGSGGEP